MIERVEIRAAGGISLREARAIRDSRARRLRA
jgi:hypothetical protein